MSKHLPITTLINLAQEELEAATKRLGKLQQERDEVQAQLNSLVTYRDEYHARFTASAQEGTTRADAAQFPGIRRYPRFRHQSAARKLLVGANQRLEAAKPEWQQQRKQKLGSSTKYWLRAARPCRRSRKRGLNNDDSDEHASKMLRMRAEKA